MNEHIEIITDEALDDVTGGRSIFSIMTGIIGAMPGTFVTAAVAPMAAPWGVIGHTVSNVVKVFKFW